MENTISLNVLSASRWVTDLVISYKEKNPAVHFKISQDDRQTDWDIQVSTTTIDDRNQGLTHRLEEEIFLAVPAMSAYGRLEEISLKEIETAPFITFSSSRPYRILCNRFWNLAEIQPVIAVESDNPVTVRDLIATGLGVAFWPSYTWRKLYNDRIRLLHISWPICKRAIVLSKNTGHKMEAVQEDFFRYMETSLQAAWQEQ